MSRDFRGITGPLPHYSTVLLTTVPASDIKRYFTTKISGCLQPLTKNKKTYTFNLTNPVPEKQAVPTLSRRHSYAAVNKLIFITAREAVNNSVSTGNTLPDNLPKGKS